MPTQTGCLSRKLLVVAFLILAATGSLLQSFSLLESKNAVKILTGSFPGFDLWGSINPFTANNNNNTKDYDSLQQQQDDNLEDKSMLINVENVSIHNDLIDVQVEHVWIFLLDEGARMRKAGKDPGMAFEVGVHKPKSCIDAAKRGFETHCFEPGAKQFAISKRRIRAQRRNVTKNIHFHNVAAGATNEGTLPFLQTGSTGDSVGSFDIWNMKEANRSEHMVQVNQVRLDDMIHETGNDVFLIKIDTQGYEPAVFSGLQESIRLHRLKFILFEYWPKGMDLLASDASLGDCVAVDRVLAPLVQAGYTLYSFGVVAHPRQTGRPRGERIYQSRPLHNLRKNCEWYYEFEKRYVSDDCQMGYWSDFLAVAPDATDGFPQVPQSPVVRIILEIQNATSRI